MSDTNTNTNDTKTNSKFFEQWLADENYELKEVWLPGRSVPIKFRTLDAQERNRIFNKYGIFVSSVKRDEIGMTSEYLIESIVEPDFTKTETMKAAEILYAKRNPNKPKKVITNATDAVELFFTSVEYDLVSNAIMKDISDEREKYVKDKLFRAGLSEE